MDENTLTSRQRLEAHLIERAMKDATFREELRHDPKGVFERELGITVPTGTQIHVLEESHSIVYVVLPQAPARADAELADDTLEAVAGGRPDPTGGCYDTYNCLP
jgi:hypothetical protein